MIYNIGILGHKKSIEKVEKTANEFFPEFRTTAIEFSHKDEIESIVDYLHSRSREFDGIIFTGKIPFDLINHEMHSQIPWFYLDQNHSQLQRTLLETVFTDDYDLLKISVDSLDRKTVRNAYSEIGIEEDRYKACIAEYNVFKYDFQERLIEYHKSNYETGKVSFCVTGITTIHDELESMGIPCKQLKQTTDSIRHALHSLKMKIIRDNIEESQIIVVSIKIDSDIDYSMLNENEYQQMHEKMKVSEQIYRFAQKIQAAVVEEGKENYLLFTTKKVVEFATENMRHLSLLTDITENTLKTVSVGIGYGTTAREAKSHAILGMNRAVKQGGSKSFVVYDAANISEVLAKPAGMVDQPVLFDAYFKNIADETGISINTIYQLHSIRERLNKDYFTTRELADEFGNSHRSMNRLIEKLELSGYVEVAGKKVVYKAGRPSRIIKLKF